MLFRSRCAPSVVVRCRSLHGPPGRPPGSGHHRRRIAIPPNNGPRVGRHGRRTLGPPAGWPDGRRKGRTDRGANRERSHERSRVGPRSRERAALRHPPRCVRALSAPAGGLPVCAGAADRPSYPGAGAAAPTGAAAGEEQCGAAALVAGPVRGGGRRTLCACRTAGLAASPGPRDAALVSGRARCTGRWRGGGGYARAGVRFRPEATRV